MYDSAALPDPSPYGDSAILRDLALGKAEIGLQMLLITASRFLSRNYSTIPSHITKSYSLIIHKRHLLSDTATGSQRMLFQTFTPISWCGIGLMLILIFTALSLSQKLLMLKWRLSVTWRDICFDVFMGVLSNDWRKLSTMTSPKLTAFLKVPVFSLLYSICT